MFNRCCRGGRRRATAASACCFWQREEVGDGQPGGLLEVGGLLHGALQIRTRNFPEKLGNLKISE